MENIGNSGKRENIKLWVGPEPLNRDHPVYWNAEIQITYLR